MSHHTQPSQSLTQAVGISPTFGQVAAGPCDNRFGFSEPIDVKPGVLLTPEGMAPTTVYWIEAGIVKKINRQANGVESITGLRTKGWIVGAAAALVPSPREPFAITATNCKLRLMTASDFVQSYREGQVFSQYVTNLLAIEMALRVRADSTIRRAPLRAKVLQFVEDCELVSRSMPEEISPLKLNSSEIAQILGASPENFTQLLAQMEFEGLLGRGSSLLN